MPLTASSQRSSPLSFNADLANGYGNLVSRTLAMIQKYFDGVVPELQPRQVENEVEGWRGHLHANRISLPATSRPASWFRSPGAVEVDEAWLGGLETGVSGRQTESKALIAVAVEEDGKGIGRIRMRFIPDASASSLIDFVQQSVEPGGLVHTDGWKGYASLQTHGYMHKVTVLKRSNKSASELLPRVHLVVSLLKRWLLDTHQDAVHAEHLDLYLEEFTFRFNRRKSRSRGKLFYRLAQQAVAVQPTTYRSIVSGE